MLLTQAHLRGRLPEHQAQVVLLDGEEQAWQQGAEHNPQSGVGPENLAYVIYTSGSTGTAQGRHSASTTAPSISSPGLAPRSRPEESATCYCGNIDLLRPVGLRVADAAVPRRSRLACARRVAPARTPANGAKGRSSIRSRRPWPNWCVRRPKGTAPPLRTVNLAGEAAVLGAGGGDLPDPAPSRSSDNLYGPTEGTTYSTYQRVRALDGDGAVPIGRTDREHAGVRAGRAAAAGAGGGGGGAVHRRGGAGAGLPEPAGADRRALRPRPVRRPARSPAVPDRRPGALAGRRQPGVPGAAGPAGEDPRLPHRAGRGRGGAAAAPGGAAGRGAAARGRPGRQAPGGLPGRPRRTRAPRRRTCVPSCRASCRSTWCPRPSWSWRRCR